MLTSKEGILVLNFFFCKLTVCAADPPPYIDGIRINSPHYLTKIKLTTPGTHTFTLVVSQYEKQNTIHYTVRVRNSLAMNQPCSDKVQ